MSTMPELQTDNDYALTERAEEKQQESSLNVGLNAGSFRADGTASSRTTPSSASAAAVRRSLPLPQWAVMASAVWLIIAVTYLLTSALMGTQSWTPGVLGGAVAGMSAPLMVIWLIALLQMRALEAEAITGPVRRQLSALLAPGMGAENRVRRVTQLLSDQADQLRQAASVALEDSSAAMNALTRQSGELRRISVDAMLEIGKVGKTAEQTLKHLHEALGQLNTQTGAERERALALVTELERHTRDVLQQVNTLAGSYETKLERLNETAGQVEVRAKSLVGLADDIDSKVDETAGHALHHIDRLEAVVAEITQRSAAITYQLARPVETLESAASTLDQNMRQSQEMLSSATMNLEKIGESAIGRASSLVSTLADRLSSMELVGAKLVSVGAAAQSETGRYVAQMEAVADRIRSETEQGHQSIRDSLRDFDEVALKALSRSDDVAKTLRTGAETLAQTLVQTDETFDGLADGLENRTERLAALARETREQFEEANLVLETAQDGFAGQLERLGGLSKTLQDEITRAEAGTARLSDASATAKNRAEDLTKASDQTQATLTSIADVLTEQQGSVQALAASMMTQVDALTASLAAQQAAIRHAATEAGTDGEAARTALREQVDAIASATTNVAARLDSLQSRLSTETDDICALADQMETRLSALVTGVTVQSGTIQSEQKSLAELADASAEKLANLSSGLGHAQQTSVQAMDQVAARLVGLRGEIEKANQNLQASGQGVSAVQGQLQAESGKLGESFTSMLSRLEVLSGGVESAGRAVAAQGQAAGALLEQAQEKLATVTGALQSESQIAQMAVAEVAEELVAQQKQLADLHAAIERVAAALAARGEDMRDDLLLAQMAVEQAGQKLQAGSVDTRAALDAATDRLEASALALQAEARGSVSAIQAVDSAFANTSSQLQARSEAADQSVQQLQQDVGTLQQVLVALAGRSDTLAASLAQHSVQAEMASGKLQGATTVVDSAATQLQTRMADLGSLAEQQQRAMSDMGDAVLMAQEALRISGEKAQDTLKTSTQTLSDAGHKADVVLEQIIERIRQAGVVVGGEAGSAETLLGEISETLRNTAEEFTRRIETAGTQLADARTDLTQLGAQLGGEVAGLQDGIATLSSTAASAREELLSGSSTITTISSDVAAALQDLLADMDRLGDTGARHTNRLNALAESIVENLGRVEVAAKTVDAREEKLLAALQQAEQGFVTLDEKTVLLKTSAEDLAKVSAQMNQDTVSLHENLATLGTKASTVREELLSGATVVTTVSADVTSALRTLVADIARLGETGSLQTDRLKALAEEIVENLSRVEVVADTIDARENKILETLAQTEKSFEALDEKTSALKTSADELRTVSAQMNSETSMLQENIDELGEKAARVRTDLATGADTVSTLSSGVAQAVQGLVGDITRLGETGTRHTERLNTLADSITGNLSRVETVAEAATLREEKLLETLTQAQQGFEAFDTRVAAASDLLVERVKDGEAHLSGIATTLKTSAEDLTKVTAQMNSETTTLQDNITTLGAKAASVRVELEAGADTVTSISSDVAQALHALLADMARLGDTGALQTDRLKTLAEEIVDNLSRVDVVADNVTARENKLIETLAQAQQGFEALDEKMADVSGHTETLKTSAQDLRAVTTQISTDTSALQAQVETLGTQAGAVREEMAAGVGVVTSLSVDVAEALQMLIADIVRLGETGAVNTARLTDLSASIVANLSHVEGAAETASARESKLLETLVLAQQNFTALGADVDSVRSLVSSVTDHAATRLADISSLFSQRVREGEELVSGATERLGRTGALAKEQAVLLEGAAEGMEQRLLQAVSKVEARRSDLLNATDQTLIRLAQLGDKMDGAVERSDEAYAKMHEQAQQNERLVGGLSDLADMTTTTLERTTQRMAMLAQQAAADSSRMMDVALKIEQQQAAIRHAADAAVSVMQSVEAQLQKSGTAGVDLIDAAEGRITDVLVAMTQRLTALSQQNDSLMVQLHGLVGDFTTATETIRQSGATVGAELGAVSGSLHTRAIDLTAAGQQFDRELKARLTALETTQSGMENYFSGFGRHLAELDTRTNGYLIDLERRSDDSFGRLRSGVDQLGTLPDLVTEAQTMLSTQVEAARAEIARLRFDLIEIGREVQEQVTSATGQSGVLLSNMQDVGAQSRLTAEQLEQVGQQIVSTSEDAWRNIRTAACDGMDGLSGLLNTLGNAQGQTETVVAAVRSGIDALLTRIETLTQLVDTSLGKLTSRYQEVSRDGFATFERLSAELDSGAARLDSSTELAKEHFTASVTMLANHQDAIVLTSTKLAEQMIQVRAQLEALRDGFGGLDARLDHVSPVLASQQTRLDAFLASVDRTLNQVTSLHGQTKDLAAEHLSLAAKVQEQENALLTTAGTLEGKLGQIDSAMSGPVLARLQQAVDHAQVVESHLGRISGQAGRLDGALLNMRQSLEDDVKAMQTAEGSISGVADRAAIKLLEVGSALNATLAQLQKGGQLSQAGMMQANEETQRLVVRLEQVRALIKNMMGTVSTDLSDWQFDLKKKLTTLSSEIGEQLAKMPKVPPTPILQAPVIPAAIPALPASIIQPITQSIAASATEKGARVRPVAVSASSAPLTAEALNALAVDLYRLLHAEAAELRKEMMPPSVRRRPMTPEDARAYTHAILELKRDVLCASIKELHTKNFEFRQYIERYMARFESQFDVMDKSAGEAWRTSEAGQLYSVMSESLGRKPASATAASASA